MRIGIIAPPWTPIPPPLYGGIELVVDQLACGLQDQGHEVLLFATGDSTCPVPTEWTLPAAEGTRIGMAVPEIRHVIHAYEAVRNCDVVHDHTMMGPFHAGALSRPPGHHDHPRTFQRRALRLYRATADRVPLVAISHAQRRAAPDIPVARVIHHGIDSSLFPVGDGTGDKDGPYLLFLGRMADDKGPHRAIEVARKAGIRILMAAKMREPWEMRYFSDQVEPLLGSDAVYLGEVSHERKLELLAGASALLFPDPLERAVRDGHDRGDGLRHPGPGISRGRRARGGRQRPYRFPLRRRGGDGRGNRAARRAGPRGLPAGGRGLLLDRAHGEGAHRPLPVDGRACRAGRASRQERRRKSIRSEQRR